MDENELDAIAEAARLATADTADYKEPEVVELDNFRDFGGLDETDAG